MKKILFLLLITHFAVVLRAQQPVPLSKITAEMDLVLGDINNLNIKKGFPGPKKVTISFESEISRETEGGIKILFLKVGGKKSVSRASETSFTYKVNEVKAMDATITKNLSLAIRNAYDAILKDNPQKMTLTGFTVKVSFTLEKSKTVEGEYEFSPVTPSLGRTWTRKAVHSLEVEFE